MLDSPMAIANVLRLTLCLFLTVWFPSQRSLTRDVDLPTRKIS